MKDKDLERKELIIRYCEEIIHFTKDIKNVEQLEEDEKTRSASLMKIFLIGETSKNVSDDFLNVHKNIDWKSIKGFRNVIAHQYEDVSSQILFNTIKINIPELLRILKREK